MSSTIRRHSTPGSTSDVRAIAVVLGIVVGGCVADGDGDTGGSSSDTGGVESGAVTSTSPGSTAGTSPDGSGGPETTGVDPDPANDVLQGYWVWEMRVEGEMQLPPADVDNGQMKLAFGTGNNKCHYIWNETTGSDFHTECTYTVEGDLATLTAPADPDGTAAGYSCAHPDWTDWNDRPAVQYSRYKFVGDRLWMGLNAYWGGVNGDNSSAKRFPFWESQVQAEQEESWIVFMPVTREEWFGTYAISTTCQGTPELCAMWPGCGPGDHPYVD